MNVHHLTITVLLSLSFMVSYTQEEFNGPYKSWANVKTRFGAKGDGKADDTRAIQTALDSLSDRAVQFNIGPRAYSVIYIPAGTYKITSTLVLRGKIGFKLVGEDPLKTILNWQGPDRDTLLWSNGSAFYSISRLTWDPGGRKGLNGIGLHWQSVWRSKQNNSSAAMNIEFKDLVFRNGFSTAIAGGTKSEGTNSNDSEILISRCVFNGCTEAGIAIKGYNALDYWIWYCRFINCSIGVECNSGNYHVYYSYFKKSIRSDVMNTNSYYNSVRYCYSTGSTAFSFDHGKSSNTFKRIFQSNTIIDPKQVPIQYFHSGKVTLIDNYCRVPVNSTIKAFLTYDTWAATQYAVLDVGNVFENFKDIYQMPVRNYKIYRGATRRRVLDSETQFLQRMPAVPARIHRTVYEVPPGASAAVIQPIINKASALRKKAVVHFPFGIYKIEKAIVLPQKSDIQIEGDGLIYSSALIITKNKNTFENGSVFKILGPSTVSIKDMDLQTPDGQADKSRAVAILNVDQPNSVCMIDQLYAGKDSSIVVIGYDNMMIQKTNSFFSAGNYLVGGKASVNGSRPLRMQCFGGQFAHTNVSNNAYFMATDCWWEGNSRIPLDLNGQGTLMIQGNMIAPYGADSNTTVRINKFRGKIALMDMYIQGGLEVYPDNPALKLMVWNINFYHRRRPLGFLTRKESYQAFFGGLTGQCFDTGDPACNDFFNAPDQEVNVEDTPRFLEEFIGMWRSAVPVRYTARAAGVTNINISRISISEMFSAAIVLDQNP